MWQRCCQLDILCLGYVSLSGVQASLAVLHLSQVRYYEAWNTVFEDALRSLLALRIASPSTGSRPGSFFTSTMQLQVCHACLVVMINSIQETKEMTTIQELNTALMKPRPPVSGCISSACQYTLAFSKICLEMKTKGEEITFSIPIPAK